MSTPPDDGSSPATTVPDTASALVPPALTPAADRLGSLWAGRWRVLIATVAAAVLTFAIASVVPQTYSSGAQVSLSASPVTGSSASDLVTASNNLAAQYAQVVTSEAVLGPAAAASGTTSGNLASRTSSGTVASQNIVLITVQAADPTRAQTQAKAIATSLIDYVTSQGKSDAEDFRQSVLVQLAPLDEQIVVAARAVGVAQGLLANANAKTAPQSVSAASARLASAQSLLTALTDRRASLAAQATLQSISLAARAQLLGAPSAAVKIEPRPPLYTLIAALLALAISSQIVVVAAERRARTRRLG